MNVYALDGRLIEDDAPQVNAELVTTLEQMLADARAGRLVCAAGVIGLVEGEGGDGRLTYRLWTHTNNWSVHDRLLARVGILRTMMENDALRKMGACDIPHPGDSA